MFQLLARLCGLRPHPPNSTSHMRKASDIWLASVAVGVSRLKTANKSNRKSRSVSRRPGLLASRYDCISFGGGGAAIVSRCRYV